MDRQLDARRSRLMSWDDLRRQAYTGSNRCWPCTAVNLAIVGVLVLAATRRDRRLTGLAVALVGTAAVAVRGYVVPYTPTFAPKLVAALPLPDGVFGKEETDIPETESLTATELDGEAVLGALAEAGVIEADGELVRPTAAVDEAWSAEMDRLAALSLDGLAGEATESLPTVSAADAYDDGDGQWVAVDGKLVARPVAVAELAAYDALGDSVTDQRVRLAGARAFRMFLDSCPVCESALVESSEVSCCGGYTDPQTSPDDLLVCPTCEQRVYTFPR